MRQRIVVLVVVIGFAALVAGAAVVAGGGSGKTLRPLPLLPLAAASSGGTEAQSSGLAAPMFGPIEYQVEGTLPRLADRAPAYTLGTEGASDKVDRLATALGLQGRPQQDGPQWLLRDGTRELMVRNQPGLPWSLVDLAPCQGVAPPPAGSGSSVSSGVVGVAVAGCAVAVAGSAVATAPARPPIPPPLPPRPADLPTRDEAARLARDLLTRAGGPGLAGAPVHVVDGFSTWVVQFEPSVDGLPTAGLQDSVSIGPKGAIRFANGWLATPQRVGDYPLAGVDKGLDRLRHGFGALPVPLAAGVAVAVPGPQPAAVGACPVPAAAPAAAGAPLAAAAPGAFYPWCGKSPVQVITGVHLALGLVPSFALTAPAHLEPAYVFELKGGGTTFPVPAVIDADLQQLAPPPPRPVPLGTPPVDPRPPEPTRVPPAPPKEPATTAAPPHGTQPTR